MASHDHKTSPERQSARAHSPAPAAQNEEMLPTGALSEVAGAGGSMQQRTARALMPLIGNQALRRMLVQRDETDTTTDTDTAEAPVTDDAMPADLAAFLARGPMPGPDGLDVTPTGIGGFNARFDPGSRELNITINMGFIFPHGLKIDPATNIVSADGAGLDTADPDEQGTLAELAAAATKIMTDIPAADRAAEVNSKWRWTGEQDQWMPDYQRTVQDAWGGKHFFVSQDWPQLFSGVRVAINVHAGAQPGDHCKAKIVKTPPGGIGAYVQSGTRRSATDQEMIMSSSDIGPRTDNLLEHQLYFAHNSASLASANSKPDGTGTAGPAFLQQYINTFNAAPGNAGQTIRLIGHASASGSADYNQTLSEQRSAAVEGFLKANGLTGSVDRTKASGEGETATDDAESRRVDLIVGDGRAQNVAAHETGHLLGLDDEYATGGGSLISGSGNPIGSSVRHSDIDGNALADAPIDGAVAENNDNIMSLGNSVRPQHYSTFHNALERVTGRNWRYGGEGDPPTVIPGTPVDGGVIT